MTTSRRAPTAWQRLVKPEVLFLLGVMQALFPYLVWIVNGPETDYIYNVTYIPAAVWIAGYVAFWLGAKAERSRRSSGHALVIRFPGRYILATLIVCVLIVLQLLALFRVYGGIPLLLFSSGDVQVGGTHEAILTRGAFGQMGTLLLSLFALNALILIVVVSDFRRWRPHRAVFLTAITVAVAGALHQGKRQGLVISLLFIACALSIAAGHPVRPLVRYFKLPGVKSWARIAIFIAPLLFVLWFGAMSRLREEGQISGGAVIIRYLEMPLINLEKQVEVAGFGPAEWNPRRLLMHLLPDRVRAQVSDRWFAGPDAPLAEPSATVGFYGELHWNTGAPGIVVFSFLVGWLAKYFYRRAFTSVFHLLVYSQMAWTLIAAHSYNHFVFLVFLPAPAAVFWLLARMGGSTKVQHHRASSDAFEPQAALTRVARMNP